MEHRLNPRIKDIQISGIRRFFNKVADYPDAISLTIGQPDFKTPEHVKEAGKEAINQNYTTYTHNAGLIELRVAIQQYIYKKQGLDYDPKSEIIATIGASEAIDITLRTLLEDGDEVILPGPVYPGYEPIIKLCGATPVLVDTTENEFKLSAELIKENISSKTKCVILPYPSNPTGVTLSKEELEDIAHLLKDKDIFVVSDEIYSELTYETNHTSIANYPWMKEKTIVINGLSKSHAMTGWRIGFLMTDEAIASHILKVHQYSVSCASAITQYAAIEALTHGINDAEVMREAYQKRLSYCYQRITSMGLSTVKPSGAFYLFPSIETFNMPSFEFASKLLEKERLAVVPGDAFSSYGDGFIRISYAYSMEILEDGLNRLEHFISTLKS